MLLHLPDSDATGALGRAVAAVLQQSGTTRALFFQGTLGSGKTTLIRNLVEELPGGDMAEVSSPSFNVYNLYPTSPEAAHFDLYRLAGGQVDESLYEFLEEDDVLVLVEWAEFFSEKDWPEEWLIFRWHPCDEGRLIELQGNGPAGKRTYDALVPLIKQFRAQ